MTTDTTESAPPDSRRATETRSFIFLAVVLAPALAVALVGGLGLAIWIFQMIAGPPGPPAG